MASEPVDGPSSAPIVIAIDPTAPFADLLLVAALTWPRSERERRQSLSAWAAMMLGNLEADGARRAQEEVQSALADAARKHGCTVEDILADPLGAALSQRGGQHLIDHARSMIQRHVFEAAGGWGTIAGAPPAQQALERVRRVAREEGRLVGRALSLIARMAHHHPDCSASLNRVWHVMATEAANGGRPVPSDRAIFMRMWREWSTIAPLLAAARLWLEGSRYHDDPRAHAEEIYSVIGVGSVLGWAKWMRHWATSYKTERSRGPLLLDAEAAVYETQVPEIEPPLLPLSAAQLAAAASYKAPTGKYHS